MGSEYKTRFGLHDTVRIRRKSEEWGEFIAEGTVIEIHVKIEPMHPTEIRYLVQGRGHHVEWFPEKDLLWPQLSEATK